MATEFPPFEPPQPPAAPPPPPTPPPPPAPELLPWENPAYPRLEALYETVKLVLFYPKEAFSRMSLTASLAQPVLFAVILGWVGMAVGQLYQWAFQSTLASLMPGMFARQELLFSKVGSIVTLITAPVWILLGLGLTTLVVHFFLLLYGGANAGLAGTFRTLAYAEATYLFQIIPLVGALVAIPWWVVISALGLAEVHQTTTGRAAGAILTPILLCCACVILIFLLAGAAILGVLQNLR